MRGIEDRMSPESTLQVELQNMLRLRIGRQAVGRRTRAGLMRKVGYQIRVGLMRRTGPMRIITKL
jgi:hypothetical protein